jgi:hypothetical protein
MKTTTRLASLLWPLLATATAVSADEADTATGAPFKPKEYELSRYSANFEKKSPFEFDPPVAPVERETDHFDDVSLGGYCGSGNTMSVYLIIGKEKQRVTVYGEGSPFKKRDNSGFRIISINRGRVLATTTVLLEKGGQQREVGFEKDTLTAKGSSGGQPPQVVTGKDGRFLKRTGVPRPVGGSGAPPQVYQPPPAFVPGQANEQFQVTIREEGGKLTPQGLQALQQQQAALTARQTQGNQPVNITNRVQLPNVNPGSGQNGNAPSPRTRRVVLPTANP